jgi:hypothetical protein
MNVGVKVGVLVEIRDRQGTEFEKYPKKKISEQRKLLSANDDALIQI